MLALIYLMLLALFFTHYTFAYAAVVIGCFFSTLLVGYLPNTRKVKLRHIWRIVPISAVLFPLIALLMLISYEDYKEFFIKELIIEGGINGKV